VSAGWSSILSRRSLRACNEKLRAACMTCRQLSDTAVPCVVSACVISTELHPNIHIMIDAVKPDDNQRARRQMSTPSDSSCTHILVFPTSATAQVCSFQRFLHYSPISRDGQQSIFTKTLIYTLSQKTLLGNWVITWSNLNQFVIFFTVVNRMKFVKDLT